MRRLVVVVPFIVLWTVSAFGGGFQVTAQGARAMGMGSAFTAVADDASAIYYNPAGLAFLRKSELIAGGMVARTLEGTFDSNGTPPGAGVHEEQRTGDNLLPQIYGAFGNRVKFGVGVYTPFGLPMRWEDPPTFTGRFSSYTAVVKTINVNPTVAFKAGGFSIGLGADYVLSKIQLERFLRPSAAPVNIVDTKLKSDLADSHGWGWNAGVLWESPTKVLRFGAAYRDSIEVDHKAVASFNHLIPGLPTSVPKGDYPAKVSIEFPSSLNLGVAWKAGPSTTIAFDADRTNWSSFDELTVILTGSPAPGTHRVTNWDDTWTWRAGVETGCGVIVCRAGYYRDSTPQPVEDIGPILPDADRQGFSVGIGIDAGKWAVDIAEIYVLLDDRTTSARNTDAYFGTYKTKGNELAINFHWRL